MEDEKNVEESEETDEEKEHTDENEDDITQLVQGPKKESGTSDLGTWLGRVNELTDREKYMALTDPFVPPRHFKFPVRTEYGKERRCQESYLNEFDGVVYSQSFDSLLCKYCISFDNASNSQSCFIKEGFSTWTKARNRLNEHFKGICSNEVELKGAQNSKKRKRRPKGYQNHLDNRLKALWTYGGFVVYSGFAYAERQTRKIRKEHKSFRFCNRHNLHIRFTKYAFKGTSR